jgi:AcrR family transcriptional regulator
LRDSARELFVRDGYHNTRPQDIARNAGVASGTFYLHFSDKKEAFLDFAEQAQSELIRCQIKHLDGVTDHRERWRVIIKTVINFGFAYPGLLNAAFLDPVLIAPEDDDAWRMYDRLGAIVKMALTENTNEVPIDYDLELISHAICGMLRQAMTYSVRKKLDPGKLIDDLSLFIDRGLGLEETKQEN